MKKRFLLTIMANIFVVCQVFSQKSQPTKPNNNSQRLDSIYTIYYTTEVDSEYTTKSTYSYDASGNTSFIQQYYWNGVSAGAEPFHKEEFNYNEKNLLTWHLIYENDEDLPYDTILPKTKYLFVYDEWNRKTMESLFSWDIDHAEWYPDTCYKEEYMYNSFGQLSQTNSFGYGLEHQRFPSTIIDYSFNSAANCLTTLKKSYYNWDKQWGLSDSTINHLNNDSLCTLLEYYQYNSTDSSWYKLSKTEFNYNNKGLMISQSYGSYLIGNYIPYWKEEYTYGKNDQLIFEIQANWNEAAQSWNKVYASKYFYSDVIHSNIPEIKAGISIYPNPGTDVLHLKEIPAGSDVLVYDMKGIKVIQQSCDNGNISVSKLSQGLYIIRILNNGNEILNQLFIKK